MDSKKREKFTITFKTSDFLTENFILDILSLYDMTPEYEFTHLDKKTIKHIGSVNDLKKELTKVCWLRINEWVVIENNKLRIQVFNIYYGFTTMTILSYEPIEKIYEYFMLSVSKLNGAFYSIVLNDDYYYYLYCDKSLTLLDPFIIGSVMAFGQYFYDFIPEKDLISYRWCKANYTINNSVIIELCDINKENKFIKKFNFNRYLNSMNINGLYSEFRKKFCHSSELQGIVVKGFEDKKMEEYNLKYPKEVEEVKTVNKNIYEIELFDDAIICLKKYKNSKFTLTGEDGGAAEVLAHFEYYEDNDIDNHRLGESPCMFDVVISGVSGDINEYAKKHKLELSQESEHHYILSNEDDNKNVIRHYYELPEEQIYYELTFDADKTRMKDSEYKTLLAEYNKIVKYVKVVK